MKSYGDFALIGTAIFIYILPAFIASVREHRQRVPILLLNLLLGWTFLGWVAALIWSSTPNTESRSA